MKNRQLDTLHALERLRKLQEDHERLQLANASRGKQQAIEACDEGERKLEALGTRNEEITSNGGLLDMRRYVFFGDRLRAECETQDALIKTKESSESQFQMAVASTADAWKSHTAVARKHARRRKEIAAKSEAKVMDESVDLWLARKGYSGHD